MKYVLNPDSSNWRLTSFTINNYSYNNNQNNALCNKFHQATNVCLNLGAVIIGVKLHPFFALFMDCFLPGSKSLDIAKAPGTQLEGNVSLILYR